MRSSSVGALSCVCILAQSHIIMYVYFLKLTTFLWIILILHPSRSSLLLDTVTTNVFWGSEGPRTDIWWLGMRTEKNKYSLLGSIFCDSSLSRN